MPPMLGRELSSHELESRQLSSHEARQACCRRLRCPHTCSRKGLRETFAQSGASWTSGGLERAPNPLEELNEGRFNGGLPPLKSFP